MAADSEMMFSLNPILASAMESLNVVVLCALRLSMVPTI